MNLQIFKLKKKAQKAIEKLLKFEEKTIEELITTDSPTNNFIVVHSGLGVKEDYDCILNFLHKCIGVKSLNDLRIGIS